jgi:HK97 family phage major capsid protein
MNRILELKQKLGAAVDKAAVIVTKARTEKRTMTGEETTSYDLIMAEVNETRETIKREESFGELETAIAERRGETAAHTGVDVDEQRDFFRRFLVSARSGNGKAPARPLADHDWKTLSEKEARRFSAFANFLRFGPGQLSSEERTALGSSALEVVRRDFNAGGDIERRAAQSDVTGNLGAYTVPQGFLAELQIAMKYYAGMLDVGPRIINTDSGNDLPMPTTDDTANKGRRLTENTVITNTAVPFGQKILKAYKYSSDLILMPRELLQDTGIDLEAELVSLLAVRIGRAYNLDFTSNSDGAGPSGILVDATLGATSTAGKSGLPQYNDLVNLKYSVNRAYRMGAKWMMNDDTLADILKLVDNNGRPLILDYLTTLQEDEPDKILGQPVVINNDMPDPGTNGSPAVGNQCVLYGAWSNFWVRIVKDFTLLRLIERYADFFQVGYVGFSRADARLVDAGQHPIKYLQSNVS